MPKTSEITNVARDAAYVFVGLGVLGFQKAQVKRVELQKQLQPAERIFDAKQAVTKGAKKVGYFFESSFQPIEEQLPEPVRSFAQKAQSHVRSLGEQVLAKVGSQS